MLIRELRAGAAMMPMMNAGYDATAADAEDADTAAFLAYRRAEWAAWLHADATDSVDDVSNDSLVHLLQSVYWSILLMKRPWQAAGVFMGWLYGLWYARLNLVSRVR